MKGSEEKTGKLVFLPNLSLSLEIILAQKYYDKERINQTIRGKESTYRLG